MTDMTSSRFCVVNRVEHQHDSRPLSQSITWLERKFSSLVFQRDSRLAPLPQNGSLSLVGVAAAANLVCTTTLSTWRLRIIANQDPLFFDMHLLQCW